jgi:C4-dicarboxylate transporter, DctM subunit
VFAALTGSSPATCAAIGKMGIPEMRRRGYPDEIATGSIAAGGTLGILIPPSLTLILYGIATETSIGRLFLAGVVPGLMLTAMFMAWTGFAVWRSGFRPYEATFRYSWREKFEALPKVLPFLVIILLVMWALYGGVATPSEAAGIGALLCVLVAVAVYRMWRVRELWLMLREAIAESVMILFIISTAILFGYMLSSLYLTQSLAEWVGSLDVNPWVLMAAINVLLLIAGCFLPPAPIILMTAPILLPILIAADFDPVWFGVIMTVNMEVGLITPRWASISTSSTRSLPRCHYRRCCAARFRMPYAWWRQSSSSASSLKSPPPCPTPLWGPCSDGRSNHWERKPDEPVQHQRPPVRQPARWLSARPVAAVHRRARRHHPHLR